MAISETPYGSTQAGEPVSRITMTNQSGASVSLITYGGTLTELHVPDRFGIFGDVVLGYRTVADYERNGGYLGALVGRYANRIAGGRLIIDDTVYQLDNNEGSNHLHGGLVGFDKRVWAYACESSEGSDSVVLTWVSPDGDQHYPGTLTMHVTYTWNDDNELIIQYRAHSSKTTAINLTNHAYFNLGGHGSGSIAGHQIMIAAEQFTPVDAQCIPSGELRDVAGTPMDLRELTTIGDGLALTEQDEQLRNGHGYDHNFVLVDASEGVCKASELYDPVSGRVMETFTDMPGIQFYAGNMLRVEEPVKDNAHYVPHSGLCLETQYFPDTPNHPNFPSCIFAANQPYESTTVYKFSVREDA